MKYDTNLNLEPVPWWWLDKLRVTGLVLSWQNLTTPIWLCWYHEADHQLSLSTQTWFWLADSWVNGACDSVTSLMSSQSHVLKLWFNSRERVSAIHYQRLKKDWTIWRIETHLHSKIKRSIHERGILKENFYYVSTSKSKVSLNCQCH